MDMPMGKELRIFITGGGGQIKAQAGGTDRVTLVYDAPYEEGDVIHMTGGPGFVAALLEDSMGEVYGYLSGEFRLAVPFGEKKISYSPKSFTGERHLLWACRAEAEEIRTRRNLARNALDSHDNQGLFPHDSWWRRCTVRFSDGTELEPSFRKTGERQTVDFPPREVEWLIVERLIKDPEDPSPFPALTQLEAWGTEVL